MSKKRSILFWIFGIIICSLGAAMISNSSFGVAVVHGPAYALFHQISPGMPVYTFGMSVYVTEAICLILLCIIVKKFRWKYLLSFATAVIFGFALDGWRLIIGTAVPPTMPLRILLLAAGTLVNACGVACYFRTEMPLEVWELFVKEYSDHFEKNTAKVKWIFDICLCLTGIALCFIFFGRMRFDVIGAGTIVTAVVNGPLIGLWGKLMDKIWPNK